jgi:cell wall-associated NlpC family hydrolase
MAVDPFGDFQPNEESLGGSAMSSVSAGSKASKVDGSSMQKLGSNLKKVLTTLKEINAATKEASGAIDDLSNAGGSGASGKWGANFRGGFSSMRSDMGAGMRAGAASGKSPMAGAELAMSAVSGVVSGIDNRTNAVYGKSLQTDRLGVLYQQTHGISQQEYFKGYRQPLQQYRLGEGGISTLLGFQAQTGINAKNQAAGVAGIRAASGYSYSTQDVTQMIRSLGSAQVNNRMTMTLGTGLYGRGGKQNNIMGVMQQIVKGSGLTNQKMVESGMQMGSMTRARLTALGVPEDMQDMVLQYAQENIQYQKKTGGRMGMYDPSKKSQRQKMGIEKNFATEQEETTRLSEKRDESFYGKQAGSFAQLEKNTQGVIKAFEALENSMSGVIGARMKTRGSMGMRIGKGILGAGLLAAGMAGAGTPFGVPLMMMGGTMAGSAFTSPNADPMLPSGEGDPMPGGKASTGVKNNIGKGSVSGLNANFRKRVEQMLGDNPNVGVNVGFRSSSEQRRLFTSRYRRTDKDTGVFWGGSFWEKQSGMDDAAPPGLSMHEIGMAADLAGDVNWVVENAHKYGLKTFKSVGEPWHIQPAETPDSRAEYEAQGAPLGRAPGAAPFDRTARFSGRTEHGMGDRMNKASATSQVRAGAKGGGGGPGGRKAKTGGGNFTPAAVTPNAVATTGTFSSFMEKAISRKGSKYVFGDGRTSNPAQSYFDCSGLVYWASSQSGYKPPNGWGNLTAMGMYDLIAGSGTTMTIEEAMATKGALLFSDNPKTDKRVDHVAISLGDGTTMEAKSSGSPVGVFPKRDGWDYAGTLPGMKSGDPISPSRGSNSDSGTYVGGSTITIAPQIYIQSTGSSSTDAHRAANEVARIVTNELKISALRGM